MLEADLQNLLCYHPYLLDRDLLGCGRKERRVTSGRIDVDYTTPDGTVLVECKKGSLRNKDVRQLRRYIRDLTGKGERVLRAYLVGFGPLQALDITLLDEEPVIVVRELIAAIPTQLALCRNGHYFDVEYSQCPYCGSRAQAGKGLFMT